MHQMNGIRAKEINPTSGPPAAKMPSEPMGPPQTVKYSTAATGIAVITRCTSLGDTFGLPGYIYIYECIIMTSWSVRVEVLEWLG
jgi:hypothetical protein